MNIQQLLLTKKHRGLDSTNRIEKQERIIGYCYSFASLWVIGTQIYGTVPRWLVFSNYTGLDFREGSESYEDFTSYEIALSIFTVFILFEELMMLTTLFVVLVFLFLFSSKYNKLEMKIHGPAIIVYTIFLFIEKYSHTSEYIFMAQTFSPGQANPSHENHIDLPHSSIAFMILNPLRLLVPFFLVKMKREEDIFMSFSKIDNENQVSNFQVVFKNKIDQPHSMSLTTN